MTFTVDISPEVVAELARQAAAHGRAVGTYAATLLEEAVHLPVDATRARKGNSLKDMFGGVKGLADDVDFSRNPSIRRPVDLS